MKQIKICILSLLVAASLPVQADKYSLGAGVLVTSNPYVGYQNRVFPIPVLGYEGEYGFFRGLEGGVYLWNDKQNTLAVTCLFVER